MKFDQGWCQEDKETIQETGQGFRPARMVGDTSLETVFFAQDERKNPLGHWGGLS